MKILRICLLLSTATVLFCCHPRQQPLNDQWQYLTTRGAWSISYDSLHVKEKKIKIGDIERIHEIVLVRFMPLPDSLSRTQKYLSELYSIYIYDTNYIKHPGSPDLADYFKYEERIDKIKKRAVPNKKWLGYTYTIKKYSIDCNTDRYSELLSADYSDTNVPLSLTDSTETAISQPIYPQSVGELIERKVCK